MPSTDSFEQIDEQTECRYWRDDEKWNARVLICGCIPGFGRAETLNEAKEMAIESANKKARSVYQELRHKYEVFW